MFIGINIVHAQSGGIPFLGNMGGGSSGGAFSQMLSGFGGQQGGGGMPFGQLMNGFGG